MTKITIDQKIKQYKGISKLYSILLLLVTVWGLILIVADTVFFGKLVPEIVTNNYMVYVTIGILFIFMISLETVINTLEIKKIKERLK